MKGLHQVFRGSDALIVGNRTDCKMIRENKSCFMETLLNQNLTGNSGLTTVFTRLSLSPVSALRSLFSIRCKLTRRKLNYFASNHMPRFALGLRRSRNGPSVDGVHVMSESGK